MAIGPLVVKSKAFAIRVIKLYRYLTDKKKEFVLSKQLLKSGTSIGANIREGVYGQSKKDFAAKMSIALKESAETAYWLELLHETGYLTNAQFEAIYEDSCELTKMLVATVKSAKG